MGDHAKDVLVSTDWLAGHRADGNLISPPGYEQEGAQRAGHIPTAKSIPWAQAVRDDGTFRHSGLSSARARADALDHDLRDAGLWAQS